MKKLDMALTAVLCVFFIPLSIWGGLNRWAGAADFLPIVMIVVAFIYSIIEGVRLKKALLVAALCALVTSSMFLPSLFFYPRDIEETFIVVLVFTILGFTAAIISGWNMRRQASQKMSISPSMKNRLVGILCFVVGILIFGVARKLPDGMPFGLLKWAFDLISIYLVVFVSIKKIIKGT